MNDYFNLVSLTDVTSSVLRMQTNAERSSRSERSGTHSQFIANVGAQIQSCRLAADSLLLSTETL